MKTLFPSVFNKKNLVAGLATLIPISVCVWVLQASYRLLTGGINAIYPLERLQTGSPFVDVLVGVGIIASVGACIVLLGLIVNWRLFTLVGHLETQIVERVPLLNRVYRMTKDVVVQFLGNDFLPKGRVVAFRSGDLIMVGFVTNIGEHTANVVVVSTPSPFTAINVGVPLSKLYILERMSEEVLADVIKLGSGLARCYDEFLVLEAAGHPAHDTAVTNAR